MTVVPLALPRRDRPLHPPLPDLDGAPASEILAWAAAELGPGLAVASSMQDTVVVDLALRALPSAEVFFLDTGFHFPETLATAAAVERRYRLRLHRLRPAPGAARYDVDGTAACCEARKVRPLEDFLTGQRAWVTGLRRAESPARAAARPVEWDAARGVVKVNPIVAWTDEEVARYVAVHDLIVNPLRSAGYDSIGCAPCTKPGRGRDGRWAGSDKLECGLHLAPSPAGPPYPPAASA